MIEKLPLLPKCVSIVALRQNALSFSWSNENLNIILASIGTDGDIFPYLQLGSKLRARGHAVTLVAPEHHARGAASRDLDFRELVSNIELDALLGHPDFWHPYKTFRHASSWGVGMIPRHYDLMSKLINGKETVLVANPGIFAAGLVHEKLNVPWANLILQPWMLPSIHLMPVMPGLPFLGFTPKPVRKLFWRALDAMGDTLVGPTLNKFRKSLGLPPGNRMFSNWLSKDRVIGLFPEWFGPIQPDWPRQLRVVGFAREPSRPLPHERTREIIEFCAAGPPPIAITFGTGMMHAQKHINHCLQACAHLKLRAIVLTKYREQLPTHLPPGVLHQEFAPFTELFPCCSTVIHHGGVGTTAEVIHAGVPQLILPFAFDQIDNGSRVQKMGLGELIKKHRLTSARIAESLERLQKVSRPISFKFAESDYQGLSRAADLVEQLPRLSR